MEIKHIWSVVCEKSIINQDDNNISIINVLEEINSTITSKDQDPLKSQKINLPFDFEVINYWIKNVNKEVEFEIKTAIFDPTNNELSSVVNKTVFPSDKNKLRSRLKIHGLSVTKNGEYEIKISFKTKSDKDFKLIAELPFQVKVTIDKTKSIAT